MHTRTFKYIPTKVGEEMIVTIDQDDEVLNVTIGDTYLGSMVEDANSPYGWETDDQLLIDELPELSMALKEESAMANLPHALKDMYGESIVDWEWGEYGDELELIASNDIDDLTEFADTIRDQINEVVLFDKHLTIYLIKQGNSEIEEIAVN